MPLPEVKRAVRVSRVAEIGQASGYFRVSVNMYNPRSAAWRGLRQKVWREFIVVGCGSLWECGVGGE